MSNLPQGGGRLLEDVGAALRNARPDGPDERFEQTAWLALLASTGDGLLRREQTPAHLTASAAVLSPDGTQTCLVFHHRMQKWVQPGGHFEPDDTSGDQAAAREVREETGLSGRVLGAPVLLSRHPAPCAPGIVDWHLDLQYLMLADVLAPTPSSESPQVQWWPADALPDNLASGVPELVRRAVQVLAAQR
ncbi:NUDIX domain-containing protein [Kineosporia rhizophila]|uniref:NUDIX hydrolase n=1 Tax=Kineosporia TaxID=49184 RepID=UPI001E2EB39F|nr:NUDIX domain-containing protein [Kineosporia sp. NBRC 101677]MCE0536834.1 NUDIX domain-containing protein [Kineosporia rhizophila]GLY13012.1 NUDIX hydrolase [Kineosporia sp. NBRC 101677]